MDIKDVGSVGPSYPPRVPGDSRKREVGAPQANTDRLELSDRAQLAGQAQALFSRSAEVREAKVSELKALIDSGRFQLDAARIARALLKGELIDRIV